MEDRSLRSNFLLLILIALSTTSAIRLFLKVFCVGVVVDSMFCMRFDGKRFVKNDDDVFFFFFCGLCVYDSGSE